MPLDSIIVRGAREHNLTPTCHSERPEGAKNLGGPRARQAMGETLRFAQGDIGGALDPGTGRCPHAP